MKSLIFDKNIHYQISHPKNSDLLWDRQRFLQWGIKCNNYERQKVINWS